MSEQDARLLKELKARPNTAIVHYRADKRWYVYRPGRATKANMEPIGATQQEGIRVATKWPAGCPDRHPASEHPTASR